MKRNEKLADRLVDIITKLNLGETLKLNQLAEDYSVSLRTIQRDINTRLAFLPLQKDQSSISLEKSALGKLSANDIRQFATLSGIQELFPTLDSNFLTSLLRSGFDSPFVVKGHHYEEKELLKPLIKKFEVAISRNKNVNFSYKGKEYRSVSPYKLINSKGIWYVAVVVDDKLKAFHLAKIVNFIELLETFPVKEKYLKQIDEEDGIFFSDIKIEVIVKVSSSAAHYFKRRSLYPNQIIEKELESGELIVSSRVATEEQILPLIKYWIPEVEVISPNTVKQKLIRTIKEVINMQEIKNVIRE